MRKIIRLEGILTTEEYLCIKIYYDNPNVKNKHFSKICKILTFKNGENSDFKITIEPIDHNEILLTLIYCDIVIFEKKFFTDRDYTTVYELLGIINVEKIKKLYENEDFSIMINIIPKLVKNEDYSEYILSLLSYKICISLLYMNSNQYIYNQILYSDFSNTEEFIIATYCILFASSKENNPLFDLYEKKLSYYGGVNLKDFKKNNNYSVDFYIEKYNRHSSLKDILRYLISYVANIKYGELESSEDLTNIICRDALYVCIDKNKLIL